MSNQISPFEIYKKINAEVFSLNSSLTMKLTVHLNQIITDSKHFTSRLDFVHNEFKLKDGSVTTNLKFKYFLSLSPKGFYEYSLSLNWDTYADFIELLDDIIYLVNDNNEYSPFIYKRNEFGDIENIQTDNRLVKSLSFTDSFGKRVECTPIIMSYRYDTVLIPAIRFTFDVDMDYDVSISRIKGFRQFLSTYNPLLHANDLINYLVSTPLLGTNSQTINF